MVTVNARTRSEWQPDDSQLIRWFRALNESYDPVVTELISLPANTGNVATGEQEARPRIRDPAGTIEPLRGRLFGTLLAHLLPQNATKQHARAPVSHCVHRW